MIRVIRIITVTVAEFVLKALSSKKEVVITSKDDKKTGDQSTGQNSQSSGG